jgi:hypothetical protein
MPNMLLLLLELLLLLMLLQAGQPPNAWCAADTHLCSRQEA